MINSGAALAFGLVCLVVGFISGSVLTAIVSAGNPAIRELWNEHRLSVERRKLVQEADRLMREIGKTSALPKAVNQSPKGSSQRP